MLDGVISAVDRIWRPLCESSLSSSHHGGRACCSWPAARRRSTEATQARRAAQRTLETRDELNSQQRPLADDILKVSSVGLGGPYNALLRSPELGERMFALLDYLRFNTSVPRRLNEFAILIQARLWTSQVEWLAHYPIALREGVTAPTLADLKAGRRPASMKADEAAVYDLCMEISTTHKVTDATYARAARVLNEQQLVDLLTLSGTYATLAMVMNGFQQELPPGTEAPLQPLR